MDQIVIIMIIIIIIIIVLVIVMIIIIIIVMIIIIIVGITEHEATFSVLGSQLGCCLAFVDTIQVQVSCLYIPIIIVHSL